MPDTATQLLIRPPAQSIPVDNLHGTAPQHKGRPDHDRVAELARRLERRCLVSDHGSRRLLDVQAREDIIPEIPVLCSVDVCRLGAPYLHIAIACMDMPLLEKAVHDSLTHGEPDA